MFWTPVRSETSTVMDIAKLTRFSWWRLTAGPDEVNLFVWGPFPDNEVYFMVGRPFPVYVWLL